MKILKMNYGIYVAAMARESRAVAAQKVYIYAIVLFGFLRKLVGDSNRRKKITTFRVLSY